MKINFAMLGSSAAVVLGAALATGALAGPMPSDLPQQVVKYGDLNLASQEGVTSLYKRISAAASHVCRGEEATRDLGELSRRQVCIQQAEDRAVRQINVPEVAAFYEHKTGRSVSSLASN